MTWVLCYDREPLQDHGQALAAALAAAAAAGSLLRSAMGGQWPRLPLLVNLVGREHLTARMTHRHGWA